MKHVVSLMLVIGLLGCGSKSADPVTSPGASQSDTTSGGDETATLLGEEKIAISIKKTVNLARIAPNQVVTYYGKTIDRTNSIYRFQEGDARIMVANQATAGMGLTLTAATVAIYFSNSFSFEDRVQSEDRCHRTGQTKSVTYIDLLSDLPIDDDIQQALAQKKSMATFVADRLHVDLDTDT